NDYGAAIATDGSGNAYVTGYTYSTDFPVIPDSHSRQGLSALYDAFVTMLNPGGTALVYSIYLGGSRSDYGSAIAVNGRGNAYVTGETDSDSVPATQDSLQVTAPGVALKGNAFVTEITQIR